MAVTTGVVGDACQAAVVAALDMAAERRRPARRDSTHDAPLDAAEMTGMRLLERFTVAAEDNLPCKSGTTEEAISRWLFRLSP